MLSERDNLALATTLEPLVGKTVAQTLFGVGVLGMALSTIIILMLINGFAFCELLNVPAEGTMHRIGCFIPAVGVVGPFIWGQAAPALATPTSVIGGAMLPIAYLSFLLLMNSRRALGDSMPTGDKRLLLEYVDDLCDRGGWLRLCLGAVWQTDGRCSPSAMSLWVHWP